MSVFPLHAVADHLDLSSIDVKAKRYDENVSLPLNSSNTASVLETNPSDDLYQAGGVSAWPSHRGLNDGRIEFTINHASLTSASGR